MVTCEQCADLIWDSLYGLLDAEQLQGLRDHVAGCPACQAALAEAESQQQLLARAARLYDTAPFVAPEPETFAPGEAAATPATRPLPLPPARTRRRWPWVAAAASILLAVAGYVWYQRARADHQAARDLARLAVEHTDHDITQLKRTVAQGDQRIDQVKQVLADTDRQLRRATRSAQAALDRLPREVLARQFRLAVLGDGRYQDGVPTQYRVTTQEVKKAAPVAVKGRARVVAESRGQPARRQVLAELAFVSAGETVVALTQRQAPPPNTALFLEVEARKGNVREVVRQELGVAAPRFVAYLAIDKAIYRQGDILFFRSLTLDNSRSQPAKVPLTLIASLIDSQGKQRVLHLGRAAANGVACGEFALTSDLCEGECVLEVTDVKGVVPTARRRFLLVNRDAPRLSKTLEFDRNAYQAGDQVRAKFQARQLQNQAPAANRKVDARLNVYGHKAQSLPAPPTNARGESKIEFKLPANLNGAQAEVEFLIREGNRSETYRQAVPLAFGSSAAAPALQVEFFPEGGDLVAGLPGRVYFRVRTARGEPANLDAVLVDSAGRPVVAGNGHPLKVVSNNQQGLGSFRFTPQGGTTYTLRPTSTATGRAQIATLAARQSGIALEVPAAVTREGEPLDVRVGHKGVGPELLVAVSSGGRLIDQATVSGSEQRVHLKLPAGVYGLLKVTVYRAVAGNLVPLAERLVYRRPTRELHVAVQANKSPYQPGQRVTLGLKTQNEHHQPAAAWLLAAAVDEKALRAGPWPAPFYLASDIRQAQDLEQADLWLRDDAPAFAALDRFLGTQGWRRFTPPRRLPSRPSALVMKDAEFEDAADREGLIVLKLDNAAQLPSQYARAYQSARQRLVRDAGQQAQPLEAQRKRLADRMESLLAARQKLQKRDAGLLAERQVQADEAERAAAALADFQTLPRRAGRWALAGLVVVLLGVGCMALLLGLVRTVRGSATTTPYFATAFASLLLCTVLVFMGLKSGPGRRESAGLGREPSDLAIAARVEGLAKAPPMDLKPQPPAPVVVPSDAILDGLYGSLPLQTRRKEVLTSVARTAAPPNGYFNYSLADHAPVPREAKAKDDKGKPESAADLRRRFAALKKTQEPAPPAAVIGSQQGASKAKGGRDKLPLDPARGGAMQGLGGGGYGLAVEYAHVHAQGKDRTAPDYQETLLWSPVLTAAHGLAQVSFDLSDNLTTFHILVFGHTSDGRLGMAEGKVMSGSPNQRTGPPAKPK